MNLMKIFSVKIFLIWFLSPTFLLAQEEGVGNWMMYFGMNKISDDFSIHTEVQYRNYTVAPINVEQLLLRAAMNYHFSGNAYVSAGYAYIPSYIFESEQKGPDIREHRVWQQFVLTNNINRVNFEHRYRIEQRWVNRDYRSRFRYRLMLFVPLNKPTIIKGSLFAGIYDEVFLNAKGVFFDRNRLYGALGYQFHETASVQIGMLHQGVSNFGKWYFQSAITFNPNFRDKKKNK